MVSVIGLGVVLLGVGVSFALQPSERIPVTVYYESLCPDSRKFFTKQLYPSLQGNLSEYVNLTLVPYGLSKQETELGEWKFTCHHGPPECQGNKLQACALRLLNGTTPEEGYNRTAVGFINCLMDQVQKSGDGYNFDTTVRHCGAVNNVPNVAMIEGCSNHPSGSAYLAELGTVTQSLVPALTNVPTVLFKNQFKKEDNDLAQENFVKALCEYITSNKPAECTKSSSASLSVSVALFVFAFVTKLIY